MILFPTLKKSLREAAANALTKRFRELEDTHTICWNGLNYSF
jgi:hypothetical protein